jgi:hypothetical protein
MNQPRWVGIVAENSPDFLTRAFAEWGAGAALVTLRKKDDADRLLLAPVEEIVVPAPGHGWCDARLPTLPADDTPAQITFTSGTEGRPKGVVLSHANLADVVTRLNAVMQVTSEIREYVGVPVYHSFGFGRCRAVTAAGGRCYLPGKGFNPVEIDSLLRAGEINALSAVPSLWRVLLQTQAVSARAAERVRWIEIGSQSMSGSEKRTLAALFPNARIVQHYGLTEASRTTFLVVDGATDAQLLSVGKPFGQVEVRISEDGRIMIRGPHVATRMLVGHETLDPRDTEGWLLTNDRGALRDGYLQYAGRSDDMINCGGLKLAPDALEASIAEKIGMPGGFAVCRIENAVRGDGILVVATESLRTSDSSLIDAALEAALASGVNARGATHVVRVSELPRTDTGKVKREELSRRFRGQLETPGDAAPSLEGAGAVRSIEARLLAILGVRSAGAKDTFVSLGGDSLRFIQASVVLERGLGYLPDDWERLPLSELDALPRQHGRSSKVEPLILVRAIAILSVVINHTGVFEGHFAIDGAAFLLLVPAGYSFGRFQLQRVIESGRARHALSLLPRVIVPTVLILGLQALRHHELLLAPLLLFNNFVRQPGEVFSYWFIEVYTQVHLLLALGLTSSWLRTRLKEHAYSTSAALMIAAALLSLVLPRLWNTEHLGNLLPQFALWYFLLGWCTLFAERAWQRWLNSALIVLFPLLIMPGSSRALWITFGGLFLNWAPPLMLPVAVARTITTVASASLYIYISHFLILEPVGRLFPAAGFVGQVLAALAVGVGFWFCFDRLWQLAQGLLRRPPLGPALVSPTMSERPGAE